MLPAIKHPIILIADDDVEDQELLEEAIHEIAPDTEVVKLWNGKEVIEYLEKCPDNHLPDAIVLDYNMPLVTGVEVLAKLCGDSRIISIPKYIWSTSNSSVHIAECKNSGATNYFIKPDSPKSLRALAREVLAIEGIG